MSAVVFPHHGAVVGVAEQERGVVSEELVVCAEGEMKLAVVWTDGLEHLSVEVLVFELAVCEGLGREPCGLRKDAADGVQNVAHGVEAPHGAIEEMGTAECEVAACAAAEDEGWMLAFDDAA